VALTEDPILLAFRVQSIRLHIFKGKAET